MHIPPQNARRASVNEIHERWANRPRYVRDLVWASDEPSRTTLALYTESMPSIPSPPENEMSNTIALDTIKNYPHLFKIVTPINIDRFQSLLTNHPNRPLVDSVCRGLHEGFWPYAITQGSQRPCIVDNSYRPLKEEAHISFARQQRDTEIKLGRFSPSFGPDLLPGMTSIAIGVVPKPHSDKFRLVVDHTVGEHAPNSFIPRERVAVPLDNLHDLGLCLIKVRAIHGDSTRLVVFKSDVSQAYRRLPLHFLWQLFQIVTIDGMRHVDRNNNFGNRAAGGLWGAFMGLVLWIAIFVKSIDDMFAYVDDSYSWEFEGNMLLYEPYNKKFPAKQTRLLQLWDELGIPHEEPKQIFGDQLTIIGLDVDPNAMTITMPLQARSDLVDAIQKFAHTGQRRPLREFQRLAGWMNWALNAYPLLRPGMSVLYKKMAGRTEPHLLIYVSLALCRELTWFAGHVENSDGVHIMTSRTWGKNDAELNLFCDACPSGMGFWCPSLSLGFFATPEDVEGNYSIFYLEALTVLCALHWSTRNAPMRPRLRMAIYTDNSNSVDMFNTLSAQPDKNEILVAAVDIVIQYNIDLRVFHIPGEDNIVADALSRRNFNIVDMYAPLLQVSQFKPPRFTLGALIL